MNRDRGSVFLHHFAVFLVVWCLSLKGCVLWWLRRADGRGSVEKGVLLCGDLPLFKALKTNRLIALKNVNTDLPLLGVCGALPSPL